MRQRKMFPALFNAETLIEGFVSGALGIVITLILCIPANRIIENVTTIAGVAKLPVAGAVILVIISMVLTLIAGFVPAKMAAKKRSGSSTAYRIIKHLRYARNY